MSFPTTWHSVKDVIQDVLREQMPTVAIERLLGGVVALTAASTGRIYVLRLSQSQYISEFEYLGVGTASSEPARPISVDVLETGNPTSYIEQALIAQHSILQSGIRGNPLARDHSSLTESCLVVPMLRDGSCLGVLSLDAASHAFTEKDLRTAETAAPTITALLEKRAILDLLKNAQTPINFYQPRNAFLQDILLLVSEASGMPFAALREAEDDGRALRCIAQCGFGDIDNSVLDLDPLDDYPTFFKAYHQRTAMPEPDVDAPHLANLRVRPELSRVRSFVVVPVIVGTATFGTLSFASGCRYNHSPLEIAGFEVIANGIGVSISNFRNAENLHDIFVNNAKLAVSLTALEVAQSARHEARNHIDNCAVQVSILQTLLQKPKDNADKARETLDKLADGIHGLTSTMDKIKEASKLPVEKLTMVSVLEVWREAVALVSGRSGIENVRPNIIGKEIRIEAFHERLRHAFLNLLLNSLDAFKERRAKSARSITITIDSRSQDATDIKIRYVDNATGIDPTRLNVPADVDDRKPLRELVFEPGVTSKPSGSGFGLYIVRRIIGEHHGSIDLIDYRNGVVFDIVLPKRQTLAAQARMEATES